VYILAIKIASSELAPETNLEIFLEDLIQDEAQEFEPKNVEGELEDYYTFTTNDGDNLEEITINGNKLSLIVNKSMLVYRDSED